MVRSSMSADQRDQADGDADDHHVARVEIGEMGHLVRHHALQLVAAERVEQAARHRDGAVARRRVPVAKALSASVSSTMTLGIGTPAAIDISSTTL